MNVPKTKSIPQAHKLPPACAQLSRVAATPQAASSKRNNNPAEPAVDREIFGARAFSAMKSGNMVLNPPPGLVFSTDARIEPFREVIIGGTGLEVSTGEAEVSLALCQSPNIVLTQHRWRKIEAPLRRMTDCSGKSHPASTRC